MCERTSDSVYSQQVEATWTDEPRNNSHARPGPAPSAPDGAQTTVTANAPPLRSTVAPSQARPARAR